jgi:hypothetical protein
MAVDCGDRRRPSPIHSDLVGDTLACDDDDGRSTDSELLRLYGTTDCGPPHVAPAPPTPDGTRLSAEIIVPSRL